MAAEKDATRTRLKNIKTDVRTISTCTATTVAELQDILAGRNTEAPQKENIRVNKAQLSTAQSTARRRAGTNAATATDAAKETRRLLSPRERYILATEVANTTLKTLADALKTQQPAQARPSKTKPPRPRPTHTKSYSVAHPLKERSVSQIVNSPKKSSSLRRSSSFSSVLTSGPDAGLVATAECARIAFAYLGTSEAVKVAGKDAPTLQLENGTLALIGKLVAHGLDHLAIKEMRTLKRRLDKYLSKDDDKLDTRPTIGRTGSQEPSSVEKEGLAALLDFGDVDRKSAALPIITNLQTYTLRVIARVKRPRIVEATWNYLKLSHASSPANLIYHAARSAENPAKAARQLESLAQTILLLCPSISPSDDGDHLQASPDIVLYLQHLAFRVRQRWWNLAKHEGDKEKELLEPFSKCLVAFSRRSRLSPSKKFKLAESLYTDLFAVGQDANAPSQSRPQPNLLVSQTLSSLAQAAGFSDEALRYLGSSSSSPIETSAAKQAARLARIATVSLETCLKGDRRPDLDDTIAATLGALAGGLGGSSTDLNSLFMEVNALRRMATRLLSTNPQTMDAPIPRTLEQQCFRIIAATVELTLRFIGSRPPTDADQHSVSRYNERHGMASKFIRSTVDSVLACCKRPLADESTWMELDSLIQECVGLLSRLEEQPQDARISEPNIQEGVQCPLVKFSNAYWAIQLQLRKLGVRPSVVALAMQKSTDLLQSRSLLDRQAGLLPMKLERLGEAFDQLDRVIESRDAFAQCIQNSLNGDLNQAIVDMAAKHPVQQIFEGSGPPVVLGRVLKSYHRSFVKYGLRKPDEMAFFDDQGSPVRVRGVMLEWQLALYQKTLSRNRQWDSGLNSSIQAMFERLLNMYTVAEFPIRRQRLYLTLLQLSQAHPDVMPDFPLPKDNEIGEIDKTEDRGLVRFARHLKALSMLKLSLQNVSPSIPDFQECFAAWGSLVDSSASWEELADQVDNIEYWLQEIQASADYLAAKGEEYATLPVLHLLVKVLELRASCDASELVTTLCQLGLQFLHLGYSGKAGMAFAKAELLITNRSVSTEAKLRWHLGYAEYLLKIGNTSKSESVLSKAHAVAQGDKDFMSLTKPSTTLSGRLRFNRILADACFVSSLLATHLGNLKLAARHARQSVVLNRRIWAALETRSNTTKAVSPQNTEADADLSSKVPFDPLSSMRNDKGIPLVMSVTHDALGGADFWLLVPPLYRALMQHSLVFAQQGLFHEAMYVAEQAEKVATATSSPSLVLENAGQRIEFWSESGRLEKARSILDSLDETVCEKHMSKLAYHSSIARVHHLNRDFEKEIATYESMEKLLLELSSPSYIKLIETFQPDMDSLAKGLSAMSLVSGELPDISRAKSSRNRQPVATATPRVAAKTSTRTTRKALLKCVPKAAPKVRKMVNVPQAAEKTSIAEQCVLLDTQRSDVVLRKVMASLLQNDLMKALELLDNIDAQEDSKERNVFHMWVRFKASLSKAISSIAEDFTFNTLPESTIAFPAVPLKARESSDAGLNQQHAPITTSKSARGKKQSREDFAVTLRSAQSLLENVHALCATTGSIHSFQQVSAALGHVTVLLSAVSGGQSRGILHPLYAAYMSEIPKCKSLRLAQESIKVEQENLSREDCLRWPELSAEKRNLATPTDFQQDYVDFIPNPWTAISLALNDDQNELFITRYENGTTPFILRLPLARHSSREMDEEVFTFADGRREFEKIIEDSDLSTRSAKDMTTREARIEWWEAREALDTQLHELLLNIENIWLGGFKGIFSPHSRQDALLARFRTSLDNILNRHLPSRRKRGAQKKANLDTRVLQLFVGLGDASSEELDLDDALTDLIYFVVDILQFNGERNAYDEIDFDAMVIETVDALRAYHSASYGASLSDAHMILILDKNLHMFPWESLPCLEKLSISRLPSLAALRERILAARPPTMTQIAQPGHHISTEAGGTSILNPSGDLTHTSKIIKPRLDDMLGSWTHIANRTPTEREFEDSLGEKDLVLYFGHGSGAQFVRSKAVRRLYLNSGTNGEKPGCATTFLFGCSSVHLSDNGIYEPSGMLASYLTAGAPAVVGMLWDVTDKDCDRFAIKAGELWGLWPEVKEDTVEPPLTVKKSKGKGKVAQLVEEVETARGAGTGRRGRKARGADENPNESDGARERRRGVGLDEAVKEARKACVLRYLNGAAAVVYGIPVYLE
ncbi:cell division-associated protein-like protein [Lentithecium fluviatile CBS 122367]|uniref:separase n=1 Tax=Lentithecium fluviatile CBS 122367 TaxID=1168545 RepID=A0A6G1JNB9_9PLEO|nr:cell division-associated protein-like protein [Lentithecium fluviatile CBS 122367]